MDDRDDEGAEDLIKGIAGPMGGNDRVDIVGYDIVDWARDDLDDEVAEGLIRACDWCIPGTPLVSATSCRW